MNKVAWPVLTLIALVSFARSQTSVARDVISARRVADVMVSAGIPVNPGQIDLLGVVSTGESASLQVVSVTDRTAGSVKVKLRCRNNQECLPFYVLVHGIEIPKASAAKTDVASELKTTAPPDIIHGGDRATLILESGDARLSLPVICLQSGTLGQTIRVASPDRREYFDAEVVAKGTVKGSL